MHGCKAINESRRRSERKGQKAKGPKRPKPWQGDRKEISLRKINRRCIVKGKEATVKGHIFFHSLSSVSGCLLRFFLAQLSVACPSQLFIRRFACPLLYDLCELRFFAWNRERKKSRPPLLLFIL